MAEAFANPRLYRNLGDGSFEDRADEAGLTVEEVWFGFVFEDFDNDGLLDAFRTCSWATPFSPARRARSTSTRSTRSWTLCPPCSSRAT
ncbi:MAG: hypothetical protein DRQ55_05905 [Planctomycetota bacterium]|nr:MAG: hypothetical protein DRQ55_05905 [Planctomycetota bacterium]